MPKSTSFDLNTQEEDYPGFGSYENVALLVEMGYEAYTKPHGNQVVAYLQKQVNDQTAWTQVGANAEMVAWPDLQLKNPWMWL